jgi:hypothetical protein
MMHFKPGMLSNAEAAELNKLVAEVERLKNLRVAGPALRISRSPANIVIECTADPGRPKLMSYGTPQDVSRVTFHVDLNPRCSGGMIVYDRTWITHALVNGQLVQTFSDENPDVPVFTDPWWCVDGDCYQSHDAPEGYSDGPFASLEECEGGCF